MDSIVDAFFPLIDFIENESNEVDTFLSDPLNASQPTSVGPKVAPSGVGVVAGRRVYDEDVIGIVIESANNAEKQRATGSLPDLGSNASIKKATVRRHADTSVFRFLPFLSLPGSVLRILPQAWVKRTTRTFESTMLVDELGYKLYPLSNGRSPVDSVAGPLRQDEGGALIGDTKFDRTIMLKRIADTRKLVTGLSRLLGPKMDVVKGLRKRTKEEQLGLFRGSDAKHDIAIYFGDLYGGSPLISPSLLACIVLTPIFSRRPHRCDAAVTQFLRRDSLP
jgi:Mg2+ and Co2+ transporter CorA